MLPLRALRLISEYSKPITRVDWRTFERAITTNVFIDEIDTLYNFEKNCALFKLVHTNMHLNIDMCLYYMTQEELDNFINYKDDNIYTTTDIVHIGIACFSSYIGILVGQLGIYFIDNNPTNNVILDIFIYANIFFGTRYLLCNVEYKLHQYLNLF